MGRSAQVGAKITPDLYVLAVIATVTALMWISYMFARILTRGPDRALASPDPTFSPDPAWAERSRRTHSNAVESVAVFAPLVVIAALIGVSTSSIWERDSSTTSSTLPVSR